MKIIDFQANQNLKHEQEIYWNKGYNMPLSAISSLLGVSRSWIDHRLLPELNYVVYEPIFAFNKTSKYSLSFVSKEELSDWIIKNSSFERQTELIDLYSIIGSKYPIMATKAYSIYSSNLRVKKEQMRPIMPKNVFDYIEKNLYADGITNNLNCKKRSDVPWKEVDPIDIFSVKNDLYSFKNTEVTRETMYRRAFLNGDTRIKICDEICLYVRARHRKMKMPFLIPYNRKIVFTRKV